MLDVLKNIKTCLFSELYRVLSSLLSILKTISQNLQHWVYILVLKAIHLPYHNFLFQIYAIIHQKGSK